uniref:C-type lectin domain-containing protein n=1 Tax=Erpetoichthys calabaricus TaxID=27687 RepID=A0A8C4SMN5_ERPCA
MDVQSGMAVSLCYIFEGVICVFFYLGVYGMSRLQKLLFYSFFLLLFAGTKVVNFCPETWMQVKANCYFISVRRSTWAESNKHCSSHGAQLVQSRQTIKQNCCDLFLFHFSWASLKCMDRLKHYLWGFNTQLIHFLHRFCNPSLPKNVTCFLPLCRNTILFFLLVLPYSGNELKL